MRLRSHRNPRRRARRDGGRTSAREPRFAATRGDVLGVYRAYRVRAFVRRHGEVLGDGSVPRLQRKFRVNRRKRPRDKHHGRGASPDATPDGAKSDERVVRSYTLLRDPRRRFGVVLWDGLFRRTRLRRLSDVRRLGRTRHGGRSWSRGFAPRPNGGENRVRRWPYLRYLGRRFRGVLGGRRQGTTRQRWPPERDGGG